MTLGTSRALAASSPVRSDKPRGMVCVIFVAGHNDRLEKEIAEDASGQFEQYRGVPKALLPALSHSNRVPAATILGRWWEEVNTCGARVCMQWSAP